MHHLSHRTDGKEEESCWRSGPLILVFRAVKIFEKITKEEEKGTRISLFLLPRYHPEKRRKKKKRSVTVPNDCSWSDVHMSVSATRTQVLNITFPAHIFFFFVLFIRLLSNDKSFVSTFLSPFSFPFFLCQSDFLWSFNCNHGWIIKRIVFFFSDVYNSDRCFLSIEPPSS